MQLKALVIAIAPALILAYEYGPPPGAAGPPSDRSCGSPGCHTGSNGTGSVDVSFTNGPSYVPGVKQHVVVTITDPAQKRWGFQATVRPAANPRSMEAGDFESTDGYTQVVCNDDSQKPAGQPCSIAPNFQFVEHTTEGTRLGASSPVSFEFDWTPDTTTTGDLLFYVAANAANGDGTNFGDHIYYKTVTLSQLTVTSPTVAPGGVVNGASFGSTIAPASWLSIIGNSLATSTRTWNASDFQNGVAPTQLDGTSITINGRPGFVGYISPSQVNVLAPDDTSGGPVQVMVSVNGQNSPASTVQMQTFSPALFLWQTTYAVAQHADYSDVGKPGLLGDVPTTPALPGETIIFYGTGFGPSNPAVPTGVLNSTSVPLANPVTAQVGGIDAQVSYAGLAGGFTGLDQINVMIPDAAPDGDLPVILTIGGVAAPAALVTVQRGP